MVHIKSSLDQRTDESFHACSYFKNQIYLFILVLARDKIQTISLLKSMPWKQVCGRGGFGEFQNHKWHDGNNWKTFGFRGQIF